MSRPGGERTAALPWWVWAAVVLTVRRCTRRPTIPDRAPEIGLVNRRTGKPVPR